MNTNMNSPVTGKHTPQSIAGVFFEQVKQRHKPKGSSDSLLGCLR